MATKAPDESTEKVVQDQEAENKQQGQKGKPDLTVGDVKYLLALSLVKNDVNDDDKIKFDDAKAIIGLLTGQQTKPDPSGVDKSNATNDDKLGVIGNDEYKRLEDLGLGRGVDVTKPYPWQSKSSFQVRKVECKNIIGTEESGQREYYEEEVDSVLTQQFNTNLTIEEPSNSLAIGIGAEHTRSFAETRKAVGHKIMTRTASFRTDCKEEDFEEKLSEWILDRIATKRNWSLERVGDDEMLIELPQEGKSKERLEKYIQRAADRVIKELPPERRQSADKAAEKKAYRETWALLQDCYDYVEHVGVTHYVHTIKLGAAEYEVLTQETYDSTFTATPSFEVNKVAKAVVSANAGTGRNRIHRRKTLNSIGRIEKDKDNPDKFIVKREAPDEAVLEIELRPLHSLVQMRALHLALKWAVKRYIQRRESKKEGPYLIACGPDREGVIVYWQVSEQGQVQGTPVIKDASLFYIIKTESSRFPHEFYIGYVGNKLTALQLPKGPANPLSKSKAIAPIPHYITADLKMIGSSNQPLGVTAGTHKNRARFSLHSSALRKYAFTRSKVDTDKWAEGGGFFINCARRMFKLDGYVAMVRDPDVGGDDHNAIQQSTGGGEGIRLQEVKGEQETAFREGEQQDRAMGGASKGGHTYTTRCKTSIKDHRNEWPWMVFHLLPGEHKEASLKEQKIRFEDLTEPLIDRSEYHTVYQSDARDFEFLFGDPIAMNKEH